MLRIEFRSAIRQRDDRRDAHATDRRFDGGVAPSNDEDLSPEVRVRIAEEMADVREILAGDAKEVGAMHVADGEDDVFRLPPEHR